MRTMRLSCAGTVILALLSGLGGAVTAESDQPPLATMVSGTIESEDHVISAQCADMDGVRECRNGRVEYVLAWNDPRLPTAGWLAPNHNGYDLPDASGLGRVMLGKVGLDGPDGSWVGTAFGIWIPDEDSVVIWILDGAGAYDGMTAFLSASGGAMSGLIIEGELPPMPGTAAPSPTAEPTPTPEPTPEAYVTTEGVTLSVGDEFSASLAHSADDTGSRGGRQVACREFSQLQNKATGMPVVVKDTISGYPSIHAPEFLTDGKYGNGCSWVAASGDSWIEIDLGGTPEPFRLVRFGRDRLEWGYDDRDPGHFTIEIWDVADVADEDDVAGGDDEESDEDSFEYREIFDSADTGFDGDIDSGESIVVAFPEAIETRYVRLNLSGRGAAVDEVELLESPDYESDPSGND